MRTPAPTIRISLHCVTEGRSCRNTNAKTATIRQYLVHYNTDPKPFVWTKSADDIMASIERFCHRISDSGLLDALLKWAASRGKFDSPKRPRQKTASNTQIDS